MMKKKGLIKIVILFVVVILVGVGLYVVLIDKDKSPQFKTEKVTKGSISASVTATGTLSAVTTVAVGTQVSGTIKEIYVDYNSPVKKGQLIALIDPDTFQAQVNQARANLNLARANLIKAEVSLQDAERNFKRYKLLIEKELIARSEFDTAQTTLDSAKAQVEASRAQVNQAEASLNVAEINLTHTRIISPVDGVVISRNVDVGQTVAASFQTPTLFSIAKDLTKMQVVSSIVEADIGMVKKGQSVEFTVDAYREHVFKGKISEVRIAPITVQNVVTYEVIILVDNQEHKLKPGMTANVSIIVDSKDDVLKIPNSALRFRMPEAGQQQKAQPQKEQRGKSGTSVWVIKDGKPKRTGIKIGISDGQYTEVVSGDIKEGDEVITDAITRSSSQQRQQSTAPPRLF